ncbi:Beta-amyrin 28-monooxygenase [Camellia lanceoleosa]|uniref:Beta-amyrin 28-monooxygenase n=1 Tax=Camellia lanceoleosa TaxID=1840588 RepID=A0ACC0GGL0_9ERIC|nr:Beta-amyrin 28-monooxygenase [Camellia lanceoleosa]
MKIFEEKKVVICGPNGNKFLFPNERKIFAGFLPNSKKKLFLSSKPIKWRLHGSTTSVVAHDVADDVNELIRTPGIFKPKALLSYLGIIDSISQQHLKTHWEGKD